jgi:hemolysin D
MSISAHASAIASGPKDTSHDLGLRIRSGLFEITACDPGQSTRTVLWTLCCLFGATLLWATIARLDIVAVAEGRLVPKTYVKVVQPAESGVVREILVQEGQIVVKGDVLLRLDPTVASADRRSVVSQLTLKQLELRRIDAQLTGGTIQREPPDDPVLFAQVRSDGAARERAHRDQIAQEDDSRERAAGELAAARETLSKLERTQGSYEQSAEAYEKLAKDKLGGSLDADEKRRNAVEHAQDLKAQAASVASLQCRSKASIAVR